MTSAEEESVRARNTFWQSESRLDPLDMPRD